MTKHKWQCTRQEPKTFLKSISNSLWQNSFDHCENFWWRNNRHFRKKKHKKCALKKSLFHSNDVKKQMKNQIFKNTTIKAVLSIFISSNLIEVTFSGLSACFPPLLLTLLQYLGYVKCYGFVAVWRRKRCAWAGAAEGRGGGVLNYGVWTTRL